jgi:hypothetical protein
MPREEVKTLNKLVDGLVEDFRTVTDFCLEIFEEFPPYYWWDEYKEKVEQIKQIARDYFDAKV